jgi:hypothetical protein
MNKLSCIRTMAAGLFIWIGGENGALAQTLPPAPLPPISRHSLNKRPPSDAKQLSLAPQRSPLPLAATSAPSPWRPLTRQPPFNPGAMLLLTDGTLMVHDQGPKNNGSSNWWRLTPDINGGYLNGTWSKLAPLPAGYAPLYFACAVLADGRVIIEGGEYNNGQEAFTNLGAIYDPVHNTWTPVPPPTGEEWSMIGAASSTVLANGTFMIGGVFTAEQAEFHPEVIPPNNPWCIVGGTEKGKADINSEETWTLLPNWQMLTVDANLTNNSELYHPADGTWTSLRTIDPLPYVDPTGGGNEMGPQILRPDGSVVAIGATGYTGVFDSEKGAWTKGPPFPMVGGVQYSMADGPAALLPSGKVLLMASPGVNHQPPSHFFLLDGFSLTQIPVDPKNTANLSAYYGYMIVLPTGEVMFNSRLGDIELYTDTGLPAASAAPMIVAPVIATSTVASAAIKIQSTGPFPKECLSIPTMLVAGQSYCIPGRQLNGVSQAAAYAEGYQSATNYPLVRIVNAKTKHVFYARTFGQSGMWVTHNAESWTHFTVPAGIEAGAATLFAVANGIASNPVSVTVAKK